MKTTTDYIEANSELLFKHLPENIQTALFDKKGFFLSEKAHKNYDNVKNEPHLYVVWSDENGSRNHYYIGKSLQKGGRWKRSHAYHLGTLAHHLLNTLRNDDQNHSHWIEHWMDANSMKEIDENLFSVDLKAPVYICFIPFNVYSEQNLVDIERAVQKQINTDSEKKLIEFLNNGTLNFLNVQHNKKLKI